MMVKAQTCGRDWRPAQQTVQDHSPKSAPVCLQDMSICQDVRVEDMGHKQGCNGVDNGKLWFKCELLHAANGAQRITGWACAAERLPGCSGAKKLGHLQLIDVRCGGANTSTCVHRVTAAVLARAAVQRPFLAQ